jgi:hypothetical protein
VAGCSRPVTTPPGFNCGIYDDVEDFSLENHLEELRMAVTFVLGCRRKRRCSFLLPGY